MRSAEEFVKRVNESSEFGPGFRAENDLHDRTRVFFVT